jgi:nitrogenase molybdenum-iron protein alpha chain
MINILGEYNIGADGWEIERILGDIGYTINGVMTGDSSYLDIKDLHKADLNLVQCHRSINYIAEMMETKFGIPWYKVNFIGLESTKKALREIAQIFGDELLIKKTEEVISREEARIMPVIEKYRQICNGRTAFILNGGSRSHHYMDLLRDLGIEVVVAGYEFAHRDDYEGREVIPTIKTDADSKNIPELHVTADPDKFQEAHIHLNLSKEKYEEIQKTLKFGEYKGMYPDMKDGQILIDDCNHHELEQLVRALHPDIVFAGVKDKYIVQKLGVPGKQLHAYDYSGPYAGFNGAIIFAQDVTNAIKTPAWKLITAPWEKQDILEE